MSSPNGSSVPRMPGIVRAVQVTLFVVSGLSVLVGAAVAVLAGSVADQARAEGVPLSAVYAVAGMAVALGIGELLLGLRFRKGGEWVRITTLIWGALALLGGATQLPRGAIDIGIGGVVVACRGDDYSGY